MDRDERFRIIAKRNRAYNVMIIIFVIFAIALFWIFVGAMETLKI